ncbi:ribose transport system permease protein [Nocardioides zeae]|uniref:Ribose transport system permease protein n=1 Tax=Nocardioides zeae TaxID=1457234 RepID=A0ACC6IJY7_9ACTN|nr:ABC transporter permease [Nocardioides zeae]MDR6210927.1 ribose transport system permease protein [Nocardioides zeae]
MSDLTAALRPGTSTGGDALPPTAGSTGAPSGGDGAAPSTRRRRRSFSDLAFKYGMVWLLVLLVGWAEWTYPGFTSWGNMQNVLAQNATIGIVAVGMTFVMISGGFDLSVGAIYAGCSVFFAQLALSLPMELAFVLAVAIGATAGLVNGLLVTVLKVNPFVATLGTASVFGGAAFLYSDSSPILNNEPGFEWLGMGKVAGVPVAILVLALVFLVGGFVLSRTVYGRSLYAVGGNAEAARLAGLPVGLLKTSAYVLVGACAGVAGCVIASRLQVGQADIGSTIALDAIAAVVIGGTSLFGGEGAVWRTAVGLLIIAIIRNVSQSRGFDINVESVITGFIIVGAVALDAYARNRRR